MTDLRLGGPFVLLTDTLTRRERRQARRDRPDLRGRRLRVFNLVRLVAGPEEFVVVQPGAVTLLWPNEARRLMHESSVNPVN